MYVYMLHGAFVALEISEVYIMGIVSLFRLFRECFCIAGFDGLIACCKYLSGHFMLPELDGNVRIPEVDLYV